MTINNFLHGKAIYSIDVCKDHIDLCTCGSVLTIYPHDPDFHRIKACVYEAKKWATKKQDIYNFVEWCIDNNCDEYGHEIIQQRYFNPQTFRYEER